MARPLRIQYPGAFYHVMNRGINHAPLFYDGQTDRAIFRQTLAEVVRLWKIRIHAFSLMDNHYHLLIETPLPNLSRAMQHLDGIYTQRFNRQHGRDGPLIRGRYKAILVQKETYFLELVRYIHLNGTRALRFPSARVDPDCSHPDYLHLEHSAPWLEKGLVLSHFSNDLFAFDQFIHQGVSAELDNVLKKQRWPAVLGEKNFVEDIRARFLKGKKCDREIPHVGQLHRLKSIEPNVIIETCVNHFSQYGYPSGCASDALDGMGRWIILVALRRYAHLTYQESALFFGETSPDAVEKFIKRHDYSGLDFFREIELLLERQMSVVGI